MTRLADRWRRVWSRPLGVKLGLGVLLLLFTASPQHYRNDLHTANESARIYAALALVNHGTARLDPVFDRFFPGWRARRRPPNMDVAKRKGHYLLDKAPGVTLAAVPVIAALKALGLRPSYRDLAWLLTLLLSALPSVAALLWLWAWLERRPGGRGALVAPALVLAGPWGVYAGLLFGHALAAALVAVGLALALGGLPTEPDARAERRAPLLGGLALGGAVLVEYPAAVLVVAVLAALAVDASRRRRLLWVVLGGLAPAVILLGWNHFVFGSPWSFSYGFKARAALAATHAHGIYGIGWPHAEALWGLLGGARRGLLPTAPWLAVGLVGALATAADRRLAPVWRSVLAGGTLVGVGLIAGFGDWHGGRCLGPRYLVFLLPLPALALAWWWRRLAAWRGRPWLGATLLGLGASSVLLTVAGATGFPYVSERIANPWFEVVLPVLQQGRLGPTMWDGILPRPVGGVLAVAAAVAAAGVLLWRARPRADAIHRGPSRGVLCCVAVGAALLHLALASGPETPGAAGRRRVLKERQSAHLLLDQPDAARRIRRARRSRGNP